MLCNRAKRAHSREYDVSRPSRLRISLAVSTSCFFCAGKLHIGASPVEMASASADLCIVPIRGHASFDKGIDFILNIPNYKRALCVHILFDKREAGHLMYAFRTRTR
jgi:hypothetical protein